MTEKRGRLGFIQIDEESTRGTPVEPSLYVPFSEPSAEIQSILDKLEKPRLIIEPNYKHWWLRFWPPARRREKMMIDLMYALIDEHEIVDRTMERMKNYYLYGEIPDVTSED